MADTPISETIAVAVRVRPLIESERNRGCVDVLEVHQPINQVCIKSCNKSFTFNHTFPADTTHTDFYAKCVEPTIANLFKGYNCTILAYGQTGSGKTHTMGTAYQPGEEMGVIPRAVYDIFKFVNDHFSCDFVIKVSFMELYKEVLYDLLSGRDRENSVLEIREDNNKGIFIPNLTEIVTANASEVLALLTKGSSGRATARTNMNAQSSRSHAVFTISIDIQDKKNPSLNKTSKFTLVDLAGSERASKTGATGQTFKEGVNINKGLLALGNVISALGDEKQSATFVGFRDSNLTRLLKDSLGGNSITIMIACVSPADYNVDETVSTLRYADRARKIKNKPIINQDPHIAEVNKLKKIIDNLKLELVGQGGPIICQMELDQLTNENVTLKAKNSDLNYKLSSAFNQNVALMERIMIIQIANEQMSEKLVKLKEDYNLTLNDLNISTAASNVDAIRENVLKLQIIQENITEIHAEQARNETEIKTHERDNASASNLTIKSTTELEINQRQESHTAQQILLHRELEEVSKNMALKEILAQRIAQNTCHMVDLAAMTENEAKIAALEQEKQELVQQLRNATSTTMVGGGGNSATNKISEQRRKRMQELEVQIGELNKRVQEQARLIKMKEKDEQRIRQLNNDIKTMKQTKVRLVRNMRNESEQFRLWKVQRERELSKLKDQDRKRLNQIAKMETMHSRQTNVLKRQVEQASAVNKRLKDALAVRKDVQAQKSNTGRMERISAWIKNEMDVFVNIEYAKASLKTLLNDRTHLQSHLDRLARYPEGNSTEIRQLSEDIQVRSLQIQDFQQKILDSDDDDSSKSRWENIQTMSEAKHALKVSFQSISEIIKKDFIQKDDKLNEQQNAMMDLEKKIEELQKSIEKHEQSDLQHKNEVCDYEEKVSVLLRQLRGVKVVGGMDKEMKQRCVIQQKVIEDLEKQLEDGKNKLALADKSNEVLRVKMEEIKIITPAVDEEHGKEKKTTKIKKEKKIMVPVPLEEWDTSTNSIGDDDDVDDPDWRKTPLARRIQRFKENSIEEPIVEVSTVKRNSSGGCTCKTNCSTAKCGCKKTNGICSAMCKCTDTVCTNRQKENILNVTRTIKPKPDDEDDAKKPRVTEFTLPMVRPRRTKFTN